jgi:hypothetical protein
MATVGATFRTGAPRVGYGFSDCGGRILFLPPFKGLNERNLRPLVSRIDWGEQRCLFEKITGTSRGAGDLPPRLQRVGWRKPR